MLERKRPATNRGHQKRQPYRSLDRARRQLHKRRRHLAAPLILASRSPRRRSLLRRAGFALQVVVAQVDELATPHLSLRELTIANASRKAVVIAHERIDAVVLAADTLVALEGEIIGKPCHLGEAREILRRLSDRV